MKAARRPWKHRVNYKTHCIQGHRWTTENTYIRPDIGSKVCKDCTRQRRGRRLVPWCSKQRLKKLYLIQRLTTAEIGKILGCSTSKVANDLKHYGIKMRRAVSRVPKRLALNGMWKGTEATYSAFHYRVVAVRGKPQRCEHCPGKGAKRFEWCNVSGNYADPSDYIRLCVSCHRRFDYARMFALGHFTSTHVRRRAKTG